MTITETITEETVAASTELSEHVATCATEAKRIGKAVLTLEAKFDAEKLDLVYGKGENAEGLIHWVKKIKDAKVNLTVVCTKAENSGLYNLLSQCSTVINTYGTARPAHFKNWTNIYRSLSLSAEQVAEISVQAEAAVAADPDAKGENQKRAVYISAQRKGIDKAVAAKKKEPKKVDDGPLDVFGDETGDDEVPTPRQVLPQASAEPEWTPERMEALAADLVMLSAHVSSGGAIDENVKAAIVRAAAIIGKA